MFSIALFIYYIYVFSCMLQFVGLDPGLISSAWTFIFNSWFLSLGNEKVRNLRGTLIKNVQKVLLSVVSIQWLTRLSILRNLLYWPFDLLFLRKMLEACFRIAFISVCICNYDLIVHSLDEDSIFEEKIWFTLQFTPNWHLKLSENL